MSRGWSVAVLVVGLISAGTPGLSAQERRDRSDTSSHRLPLDIAREFQSRWNSAKATIQSSRHEVIAAGREVGGNVAIRDASLEIRGRITGNVVAVNSDVTLYPGARVDGDIWVVGGKLTGATNAMVGGEMRQYSEPLVYRPDGDRIVVATRQGRSIDGELLTGTDVIAIAKAGPYNRVEGLPIRIGPMIRQSTPWGAVKFEAPVIVRTGTSFEGSRGDVGHTLLAEAQYGIDTYGALGLRAFSVVDPVESWQMSNLETELAAFLARRDYRDYYERHGGSIQGRVTHEDRYTLDATFSDERWSQRDVADPFTMFRNSVNWRTNPLMDAGRLHLLTVGAGVDTRNTPDDPWSGWLVRAEIEEGRGTLTSLAPTTTPRNAVAGAPMRYSRGFLDARRYNRLSPNSQLNLRVVMGGWLGGDELPLQRRLSVDGPGAVPGFDFRAIRMGAADVGTCTVGTTGLAAPTECERMALAQVEFRGGLHFGSHHVVDHIRGREHGDLFDDGLAWVMFADAGRGWLVGDEPLAPLRYSRGTLLPPTSTFRTDVGLGLDLGGFGIYAAKAVSDSREHLNVFVRVRRRF